MGIKHIVTHSKKALLIVMAFAISVSTFSMLLPAADANAAIAIDAKTENAAKSYTSYIAMWGCAKYRLKDAISTSATGDSKKTDPSDSWFGAAFGGLDSYVHPSGKKTDCGVIFENAAKIWGIEDYGAFLIKAGYAFNISVPEYKYAGTDRDSDFMAAIKSSYPSADTLTSATKYAIYFRTLEGDCKGTDVGPYSGEYKKYADEGTKTGDDEYIYSKVITAAGERVYKRVFGGEMMVYGWHTDTSTGGTSMRDVDCGTITNEVNANAPAFTTVTNASACATSGPKYTDTKLINACANGMANKNTLLYCPTTYIGVYSSGQGSDRNDEKKACFIGQGKEGGYACYITLDYTTDALLRACINGSQNKDENYCNTTYAPLDNLSLGNVNNTDPNKEKREACKNGQTIELTSTPVDSPTPDEGDCEANADANEVDCATTTSCNIPGVGWIVCPVFNFLAGIADGAYGVIEGFLQIKAGAVFDTNSGTYTAWSYVRAIANVGFVIVFLIIILSQVSGFGVSNYGVKKLLPRLIVGAILVNASFFVCQLAVDLSNVLGSSIKSILDNVPVFGTGTDFWSEPNPVSDLSTGLLSGALVVAGVGAAAIAIYTGVGLLLPLLLGAVLAIALVFVILIAREAAVILLVALSPLAFLAMLLPNTENIFKQWRKIFVAMLVLYPMVALLFGGARMASGVLLTVFGGDQVLGQIIALAVSVLPLFAVPTLLKNSLNAIPAVGNIASKLQTRANGFAGRKAKEMGANTTIARGWNARKRAKGEIRDERAAKMISGSRLGRLTASGFGITKSGKEANRAVERIAAGTLAEAEEKQVRDAEARLSNVKGIGADGKEVPLSTRQLLDIIEGGDVKDATNKVLVAASSVTAADKIAAARRAGPAMNASEVTRMVEMSGDIGDVSVRKAMGQAIRGSGGVSKAPWFGGQTIAAIEQGTATADSAAANAAADEKVKATELAGSDAGAVKHLVNAVATMEPGARRDKAIANLKAAKAQLGEADSARLKESIGVEHMAEISKIDSL